MRLTERQFEANALLAGDSRHVLLYGGSRSGKTYLIVRAIVLRAMKAERSRHAILRFRFNHLRASVIEDTFPTVMDDCFPEVSYKVDKTAWFAELPNHSQIWFGGLDEKERVEKVLGQEHSTIFANECSQIAWPSIQIARTRLAQQCTQTIDGHDSPLPLRMYYDCNPPSKAHWSYQVFFQRRDPESKQGLQNPENYAALQMNPQHNTANLAPGYLEELSSLASHRRKRFLAGEYGELNPNALWVEETLDRWRVLGGELPDMQRVVVAVDPSGADDSEDSESDEIGIVVAGLGTDGVGYLLEDLTLRAGPATWGGVAATAYDRHRADCVVGETNYGGAMVEFTVRVASPDIAYRAVTASRGKVVRAEPIAALYEQGRVRHVGQFPDLEEELLAFSTTGYTGARSPNRADAAIWAFSELFPGLTARHGRSYQPPERIVTGYTRAGQSRRGGAQGSAGWIV